MSMVCCLERAACGGVTELWRNQGNEIFLRAFFTIVAGFPAGDVMTVLPRVQFTCTKYPTIIVCGMRNGMIEDVIIKRTSGMLSFFFSLFFSRNQSFPQQVRKSCPPPIRHTHHRADPFDPSVAPVLIPLPIVPRIVPPPSSLPHPLCHTTLLRISHPITTTLPSHFSSISTLSLARACMCVYVCGLRSRLLAFRLFSNPTQRYSHDIPSLLVAIVTPPPNIEQIKERIVRSYCLYLSIISSLF